MAKRIAFVACCKTKLGVPAAAEDLYRSPLFRKSAQWAALYCDDWYVLSAKHRLVHRKRVIEPYDVTLAAMDADDQRRWAFLTWRDIGRQWGLHAGKASRGEQRFVVLAGELYRAAFTRQDREIEHEAPLAGLGIGQRLRWLDEAIAGRTTAEAAAGLFDGR